MLVRQCVLRACSYFKIEKCICQNDKCSGVCGCAARYSLLSLGSLGGGEAPAGTVQVLPWPSPGILAGHFWNKL